MKNSNTVLPYILYVCAVRVTLLIGLPWM